MSQSSWTTKPKGLGTLEDPHGHETESDRSQDGGNLTIGMQLLQMLEESIQSLKQQGYLPPDDDEEEPLFPTNKLELYAVSSQLPFPTPALTTLSSPDVMEGDFEESRPLRAAPTWSPGYSTRNDSPGSLVARRVAASPTPASRRDGSSRGDSRVGEESEDGGDLREERSLDGL